jgi:hypothetical protein
MFKNIKRNPKRIRKVARRTAINPVDAMTPQGQAIYCNEFIDNAYAYNEYTYYRQYAKRRTDA